MNNVMLLGEIKNSVTVLKSILVKAAEQEYFVMLLTNNKVLFVQSYTKLFKKLLDKYDSNSLDGSQIISMTGNNGASYLEVI